MDDLNERELLEGLDVMRADSIAHWNDEFAKDAWTDEKRQKETRGIKQAYAQLRKIVEGHFREPMRADEEKIRFDIPTCHHAYKMLDKAENLWCDDCVIRAIDTVAEQLLTQRPMQVDEELIERTLEELSECCDVGYSYTQDREWGELDKEKAEAIIRQLLTQKRVVTREKELQNGRARQIKSINKT